MADWKKVVLAKGTSTQYIKGDGTFATFTDSLPLTGGTVTGDVVIKNNNGNASQTLLILRNNDNTSNTETDQTAELEFQFKGTTDSGVSFNTKNAGKIVAGKDTDYFTASADNMDSHLKFYTSQDNVNTLALTIDSNQDATFAGDVRLGVNKKIYASSNSTNSIEFYNGATGAMNFVSGTASYDYPIEFRQNDAQVMTIKSQRVGIGTQSPAELLHLESAEPVLRFTDSDDSKYHHIFASSDDLYISADRGTSGTGGNIIFRVGSTSEKMRIDGSGNVGIGVSPSAKLDINISSNARGYFSSSIGEVGSGNFALQVVDSSGANLKPLGFRAEDIRFATGSAERMRIDSSGNVGIGTTGPSYKLDITGPATENGSTLRLNDAISSKNSKHLLIQRSSSTASVGIAGSQANDPLWISRSGGYDLMVASGGDVGIGTSTPSSYHSQAHNLVIYENSNSGMTIASANNASGSIFFADSTTGDEAYKGRIEYNHGTNKLHFGANSVINATLDASGNFGLGTSSPSSSAGVGRILHIAHTSHAGIVLQDTNSTAHEMYSADGHMYFYSQSLATNTVKIGTDGNVGIGTTNPRSKLHVAGGTASHGDDVYYYENVAFKDGGSSETGTLKITLPMYNSTTMLKFTIEGFDYSGGSRGQSWTVETGGYIYNNNDWYNYYAHIRGRAPFSSVRLSHDGSKNVILLGTTSTTWAYPKIVITEVLAGFNNADDWGSGYSMSWITSETGIGSNIYTPTIDYRMASNGDSIFNVVKTQHSSDTADYVKMHHDGTDGYLISNRGQLRLSSQSGIDALKIDSSGNVSLTNNLSLTNGSPVMYMSGSSGDHTRFGWTEGDPDVAYWRFYQNSGLTASITMDAITENTAGGRIEFNISASEAPVASVDSGGVFLGKNAIGQNTTTELGGYGVLSTNGLRYGNYGWLTFNAPTNNYTASSRGWALTNGYKAHSFALLMSTNCNDEPVLTTSGETGTNTTAPLVIDNSGNTTLGANLSVDGNLVSLEKDIGGNASYVRMNYNMPNSTDDAYGHIGMQRTSSTTYLGMLISSDSRDGIRFNTANGTPVERMRIDASGNVSIGDDTPQAKLHVELPNHDDAVGFYNGSTNLIFMRNESNTGRISISGTGGYINLESSNSRNSYINTSANFGIGTSSPSYKLDVNGTGRFSSAVTFNNNIFIASGYNLYLDGGSNTYIKESTADIMTFTTGGTERVRIDSSGNVGIGLTTTLSKTLHVQSTSGSASIPNGIMLTNTVHGSDSQIYMYAEDDNGTQSSGVIKYDPDLKRMKLIGSGNVGLYIDNTGHTNFESNANLADDLALSLGSSTDAQLFVSSSDGHTYFRNNTSSADIIFKVRVGSTETQVLRLDGGAGNVEIGGDAHITSGKSIVYSPTVYTSNVQGIKFDSASYTNDAIIQPVLLGSTGISLFTGSNCYVNTSGSLVRYNTSEESSFIQVRPEGQLTFGTSGTSANPSVRMTINSSGNVGIGETSPSYKLDVVGDYSNPSKTAADTAVVGISAGASGSELVIGGEQTGGKVWIQNRHKSVNGYDYPIAIQPQGGITSFGGNVGIGVTSPSQKLEVAGSAVVTNTSGHLFTANGFGNSQFYITATGQIFHTSTTGGSAFNIDQQGTGDIFTVETSKFIIKADGNVGIGSASPTDKLYITDGASAYSGQDHRMIQLKRNAFNDANNASADTDSFCSMLFSNKSNGFTLGYGGSSDRFRFVDGGNVERVSILNGGNVGIGNTNPSYKLHVAGTAFATNLTLSGWSSADALKLNYGNATGTVEAVSFLANGGTNGNIKMVMASANSGDLILNGANNTNQLTLYRDGNVGIGTTSPSQKLHVSGSTVGQAKFHSTGSSGARIYISDASAESAIMGGSSTLIFEPVSGTEKMRITSDGKVGIGTASPDKMLHVSSADNVLATFESTDSHATVRLIDSDTTNQVTFTRVGDDLEIVKDGGNVSIGKDNPTQALDVEGSIISSEVLLAPTYVTFIHSFYDDIGTTAHYLPWGNLSEATGNDSSATSFLVPMSMTLKKLFVRIESISNPGNHNLTVTLIRKGDGTITNTTVGSATKTFASGNSNKTVEYLESDFSSSPRLSQKFLASLKIQFGSDYGAATDFFVTSVWEMNNNTL